MEKIVVADLSKSYGEVQALKGMIFSVEEELRTAPTEWREEDYGDVTIRGAWPLANSLRHGGLAGWA